jgi:hypothetical protein
MTQPNPPLLPGALDLIELLHGERFAGALAAILRTT